VTVKGDPGSVGFTAAKQIVDAYTQAFAARASGQPPLVRLEAQAITADSLTQFDFIAPGLMVYAIIAMAPQAAAALARETELKTIDRIRASPLRAVDLLGGVALAQLALACVSLTLMLVAAHLMGFHNQGSYASAFVITLGAAVAVVGIGLVIAAFAKTQQEAANIGVLVSVPGSFLSGAFFPIPGVNLFTVGETTVGLYDVLPTTHAVRAMRDVMTFGKGLDAVAGGLAAMALLALLFFATGIVLYRRNRLAPE
jgi:ABC-2 type transport system permease protein